MIYITQYAIIGSRCTGTYAVNAPNKREANRIVKAIDRDYTRITSLSLKEYDDDTIMEDVPTLEEGKYYQIECGT